MNNGNIPSCPTELTFTPITSSVPGSQIIRIERTPVSDVNKANAQHVASGRHRGIVINKETKEGDPRFKKDVITCTENRQIET